MTIGVRRILAFCILSICAHARQPGSWSLARSDHFEVYAQGGDATARAALEWFEQLRTFFLRQTGLAPDGRPQVRVIGFASVREYEPYGLRAASDAYYVGTESRDYIVMAMAGGRDFQVAAHEYTHLILHASRLSLPPWLNEGLAECFSTVRIGDRVSRLGGELRAHTQLLQQRAWMPLPELLRLPADSPVRDTRSGSNLFYAESWALTEMLMLAPDYRSRFPALLTELASGAPAEQALVTVYARPLDVIARDLRAWPGKRRMATTALPGIEAGPVAMEVSEASPLLWRSRLAEIMLAAGQTSRAEPLYRDLVRESPGNADLAAALGTIAMMKGDRDSARQSWSKAIQQGVSDPDVCYRYAVLADSAGLDPNEIRPALERAVQLKPDFDEAHYTLALLEKNDGRYEAALAQFKAMKNVGPARVFEYWSAVADAHNQLGQREEAEAAAHKAATYASSQEERIHAAQLALVARTDVAVQFTRGTDGRPQLVTTRIPHQSVDFNPFIEPSDDLRRVEGKMRELDCSGPVTRILVDTPQGTLTLAIPDLLHVQVRHAPGELICGPQESGAITVEYAAAHQGGVDGIVRGIDFRR
jgi:tetratricopeptide (TPR) repeat protein